MLLKDMYINTRIVARHELILFWNNQRILPLTFSPLINLVPRIFEGQLELFLKTSRQFLNVLALFLQCQRSLCQE